MSIVGSYLSHHTPLTSPTTHCHECQRPRINASLSTYSGNLHSNLRASDHPHSIVITIINVQLICAFPYTCLLLLLRLRPSRLRRASASVFWLDDYSSHLALLPHSPTAFDFRRLTIIRYSLLPSSFGFVSYASDHLSSLSYHHCTYHNQLVSALIRLSCI